MARRSLPLASLLLLGATLAQGCITSTTVDAEDSARGRSVDSAAEGETGATSLAGIAGDEDAPRPCEDASAPLLVFRTHRARFFQRWDSVFQEEARSFNQSRGFIPGDPGWLDPNLLKSWAIQESGSLWGPGADAWASGDIFQVNLPQNWSSDKLRVLGITKGQALTPRQSTRAAILYALHKGSIYRATRKIPTLRLAWWEPFERTSVGADGRVRTEEVQGVRRFFTGWDNALLLYNGNRNPTRNYRPDQRLTDPDGTVYEMREHYVEAIRRRVADGYRAARIPDPDTLATETASEPLAGLDD